MSQPAVKPSVPEDGEIHIPAFHQIGVVHSCYKGKFGIPRQPGLVPEATGDIELLHPFNQQNLVRGLEQFSHIWVLFLFHLSMREHWKDTVRPPRLGGDVRVGVFASRSPFRPNPIGLSVMKLEGITIKNGKVLLHVSGLDILDGSPVLDVKPYIPFADSIPDAIGGFAPAPPDAHALTVQFTPECEAMAKELELIQPDFISMAEKIIGANPRPAYQDIPGKEYNVFIYDWELAFDCRDGIARVFRIQSRAEALRKLHG